MSTVISDVFKSKKDNMVSLHAIVVAVSAPEECKVAYGETTVRKCFLEDETGT